ncbi:molybdopterin-guanine dinucleotide biosynthesis protein B [Halobacillus yeomjeoni]|uniref:Molybdopterin-guanine dinucleotide biosynthesis protein B n=1 Tax=Halobacillus yeomjeoni TaxID=311194 RepID=A0A931HSW9_9BACI|nr:molybdopterin-guanine dinucleotide biosynthesis protein B [Halobacillus yeomjeoni]MBH0228773.1 molybdopterin-guanine dinucleotide biosynthesis protein B [Halobacillus yeomjeoni]
MVKEAPVFQIVGFKNSGKTSLLQELIAYGTGKGEQIAAIKHHGHDEPLKVMHHDTDSYRLHESGAFMTGVDSARRFQLELDHRDSLSLARLVELYRFFNPDLIVIEGFKNEPYPKAVVIKRLEDLDLLELSNIKFVITWDLKLTEGLDFPVYHLDDWRRQVPEVYQVVTGGV